MVSSVAVCVAVIVLMMPVLGSVAVSMSVVVVRVPAVVTIATSASTVRFQQGGDEVVRKGLTVAKHHSGHARRRLRTDELEDLSIGFFARHMGDADGQGGGGYLALDHVSVQRLVVSEVPAVDQGDDVEREARLLQRLCRFAACDESVPLDEDDVDVATVVESRQLVDQEGVVFAAEASVREGDDLGDVTDAVSIHEIALWRGSIIEDVGDTPRADDAAVDEPTGRCLDEGRLATGK